MITIMITCSNEMFFKLVENGLVITYQLSLHSINTRQVMCTEYYMSPAACEIMNIRSTKNSMITDDYR